MKIIFILSFIIGGFIYPAYEQDIPDWGPGSAKELKDLLEERRENFELLIDNAAYRGNPSQNYRLSLRDVNTMMKDNYDDYRAKVGRNLYPLIIIQDDEEGYEGVGSSYTLYLEDGTTKRIVPVSPDYETYKDLSHMVLGVYVIIAPYFKSPNNSAGWHEKLRKFQNSIRISLRAAGELPSNSTGCIPLNEQIEMMHLIDNYITNCFETKSVDYKTFQNFTEIFSPYTMRALKCAADLQVADALPQLQKWKDELGQKKWRDLYVLVPVVWTVAGVNARQLILQSLMDPDRNVTHALKIENAPNVDFMRSELGRIVGDRTMAQLVFGTENLEKTSLNLALSTRRDLIASACEEALKKYHKSP